MGWGSYGQQEPEIIYIKNIEQLDQKYPFDNYYIKTIFAKYHVIDVTHDNKLITAKASPKKAEERKLKHLGYKKHAKCEIIIKEVDIQNTLNINISNIFGTTSCLQRVSDLYKKPTPMIRDNIIVDKNINMKLRIDNINVDKYIITKTEKQMRLTILSVSDDCNNVTTITLFDNPVVDQLKEDQINYVQITNAEVNMRGYENSEPVPDGLKIPSWAKIEVVEK